MEDKEIVLPEFKDVNVKIREQYIDENGHISEREKSFSVPLVKEEDKKENDDKKEESKEA